jgi:hypothetical protein
LLATDASESKSFIINRQLFFISAMKKLIDRIPHKGSTALNRRICGVCTFFFAGSMMQVVRRINAWAEWL